MSKHILSAALAISALGQPQPDSPVLRFDPPPNFYRGAAGLPEEYSSTQFDANLQVYPFRPVSGNIEQTFQRTLLREWIDPRFQETNVAGQPEFRRGMVTGADLIVTARFAENIVGIPRQRLRMLIVSGSFAALIDSSANNMATWQRALPA